MIISWNIPQGARDIPALSQRVVAQRRGVPFVPTQSRSEQFFISPLRLVSSRRTDNFSVPFCFLPFSSRLDRKSVPTSRGI